MTYARQRTLPVLALLLAMGAASPALAQVEAAKEMAKDLADELEKDDLRWSKSSTAPGKDHPVLKWVSGQIYIVRPSEPGPNKKAELAFGALPKDDGSITVQRRTLGKMEAIDGVARLRRFPASFMGRFGQHVLLLEVKYNVQPARGAKGALGREAGKSAKQYMGYYTIRAKGNALLGRTTAPKVDGEFDEKAIAQGVTYRRAGSLMEYVSKADDKEKARMKELREQPTEGHCWVTEFSASAEENTSIRRENLGGVAFYFNPPEEIVAALAIDKPKHVFVMAHGWSNDSGLSLEFGSNLVKGIRKRLEADGLTKEDYAFVFVSWNSMRANFMESALCAETIGHRGVAPMLFGLRKALPDASLTLVGHSLGGRMMLATLQGPDPKQGAIGRWKQNRFRAMTLKGRDALDGAFWRLLHRALRGRFGPAPKVDAVVLLEAAIDVQTLHDDIGLLNYGDTPCAEKNAKLIANAHSRNDDILRLAYTASNGVMNIGSTIMKLLDDGDGIQALGRLGAERAPKQQYASMVVKAGSEQIDMKALNAALSKKTARPLDAPNNRFVNVDVTALLPKTGTPNPEGGTWSKVESHTQIFQPAIFDLIWQATKRTAKSASAK